MRLKIVLVGERQVGKTSLLERYLKDHFAEEYTGTLGGRVYPVELEVGLEGDDIALVQVAFFDLMGEHSVRKVFAEPFFFGTQGVLAVCDVTRKETLKDLDEWVAAVVKVTGNVPIEFLANKSDLSDQIAVTEADVRRAAEAYEAPYLFTSAKTGLNVEDAFAKLAQMIASHSS